MKVNISVDDELIEQVDTFASSRSLSRSALFSVAVKQFITAEELKSAMLRLSVALERISSTQAFTESDKKELNDIVTVCRFLSAPPVPAASSIPNVPR